MHYSSKHLPPSFRRALGHFANRHQFAKAMLKPWGTVAYWFELGYIPEAHAMQVERATGADVTAIEVVHDAQVVRAVKAAQKNVVS